MNMDSLSDVEFGDLDSLNEFFFENAMQHRLYAQILAENGILLPQFPLFDARPENLDDWRLAHQIVHQAEAAYLGLESPFSLLDSDFNIKEQFDDFISLHLYLHQQAAQALIN